jgi:hypothetical protein
LIDAAVHAPRNLAEAMSRLNELGEALKRHVLGPAREEFYRHAFGWAQRDLDPELLDDSLGPSAEGAEVARSVEIAGRDQARVIDKAIEEARLRLSLASAAASLGRGDGYELWRTKHTDGLELLVRTLLSDAQIALREAVARLVTTDYHLTREPTNGQSQRPALDRARRTKQRRPAPRDQDTGREGYLG